VGIPVPLVPYNIWKLRRLTADLNEIAKGRLKSSRGPVGLLLDQELERTEKPKGK
jgi:hypothetical protein